MDAMGACPTGASTTKLFCFCVLFAACFLLIVHDSAYHVNADEEKDTDLVFDNVEDRIGHRIRRQVVKDTHSSNNKYLKSSHNNHEEPYWLKHTVQRIKRQWDFWNPFATSKTETTTPSKQEGQQTSDDDENENIFDNSIHRSDDDDKTTVEPWHQIQRGNIEYFNGSSHRVHRVDEDDDEDLNHVSGEGSAGTELPHTPFPSDKTVYFRITFAIHEPYIQDFSNRSSEKFRELDRVLSGAVNDLYEPLPGTQFATVLNVQRHEDPFISKVTIDLSSKGYSNKREIERVLFSEIQNSRRLGPYQASPSDFHFREFDGKLPTCAPHEIPCHSGECVPASARCNRQYDCSDGSDEQGCTVFTSTHEEGRETHHDRTTSSYDIYEGSGEVINEKTDWDDRVYLPVDRNVGIVETDLSTNTTDKCRADDKVRCGDSSVFICADHVCDGFAHCPGGEDEKNCSDCATGEFGCDISRCIPLHERCDGITQCQDTTDEQNCDECAKGHFKCDERCIPESKRCNGIRDCQDGSDEYGCAPQCTSNQFMCNNGECIDSSRRCDGYADCYTSEDESNCPPKEGCNRGEFECGDRTCIPLSSKCDRKYDCDDRSDERNCPCKPDDFKCHNGFCIPPNQRCDGTHNCQDGSDEIGCPTKSSCESYQWQCNDGTCIDNIHRCNLRPDCPDRSDEIGCTHCKSDEFRCNNGTCINIGKRCDGEPNCPHSEDEESCETCDDDEVRCEDGKCVVGKRCDDIFDCVDGSDERNCKLCAPDEFPCFNGECINENLRCDGVRHCSDGSDEEECVYHCPPDKFRCSNGLCLDANRRCDGYPDCPDKSDEEGCQNTTTTCGPDQFQCHDDKICIASAFHCDGYNDCRDNSDEIGCSQKCSIEEFECKSDGRCIPESLVCDRRSDCSDGSDEQDCPPPPSTCGSNQFQCDDRSCIPSYLVCNGAPECQDGSDEKQCPCQADQFQCLSGECISINSRCNKYHDCRDGSDEYNCPTEPPYVPEPPAPTSPRPLSCPPGHQPCSSGNQCILHAQYCDGHADCYDLSDETNCRGSGGLNLRTYPNAQDIKENIYKSDREVVFQCRDEGPLRAKVHWIRGSGLPMPPGFRDVNGRLEMPNVKVEHSGTYICEAIGYPPSTPGAQVSVHLQVDKYIPPPTRPPSACALHEATCSNGDCIPKSLVCNGKFDCTDGSDETRCNPHGCEPNEFRCANKRCVLKTWRCDSDDDCGDGSDEANCATNPPGSPCAFHQFACHSNNQCIPKSFHCDMERDCVDGSDEIGCSSVVVVKPPPPMVNLETGSIFVITCTAVGVPTPEIVWRLNWGHIPAKCTTTSEKGVGTLTCPDIRPEDQGAYSCEAINIRGSIIAVPDTILVVEHHSVCPKGYFNEEAKNPSECISCFCFGHSSDCKSADLFIYQFQPPFDSLKFVGIRVHPITGVVDIRREEPIYKGAQPRLLPIGRNGVHAQLASPYGQLSQPDVVPYFSMPENYHGNQLKSYGGYLRYNVRYEGHGRPVVAPSVILTGNGYTLLHEGPRISPGRDQKVAVRFFVGEWVKRTESAPEKMATREEIMMALAAVDNILIKLQYVDGHLDTSISNIEMDSAATPNSGLGQASFVEECKCPVGYTGYSCENCAPGFSRHRSGPWLGQCYKEPETCEPGTYGDPARGIPCEVCPCPLTNPSNQFGRTCSLGPDNEVTCNCPPGYIGRRCEQCAAGYTGNPLLPGDSCKPGVCNPEGSVSAVADVHGRCQCKDLTDGPTCNHCKPNSFHLSSANQFGCISCFCMGITKQCTSSNWYRDQISTAFISSPNDFKLVELQNKNRSIDSGLRLDQNAREIVYNEFPLQSPNVYYWSLPSRYLGDKITSYGGYLRYTLRYVPTPGGQSSRNTAPDVELVSANHLSLLYFGREQTAPNTVQSFSVPLLEQYWQRSDGQKADREHLLMALADLEAIYIKATYTTNTREVALISVSLDIADERNTGLERALPVEQCHCPVGYKGLSCEDCDVGYTRADYGIYLGLCEPCNCNGHSNECDSETGECFNCRDHTTGEHCDQCLPGYQGDPHNRTPCHFVGGVDCNCDPRGSISNECYQGTCRCKTNVEGNNCDRCRPGTFGLDVSNSEGCAVCFCSGVANECSESSMYREQIPVQIIDPENHGFTLTDQYQREVISTGFQLNIAMNEIGYIFRPSNMNRWYWSLPRIFTGFKIKSYGGRLEFTQRYTERPQAQYVPDQDVIIIGNGITIYWTNPEQQAPDIANKVSVLLSPKGNWHRLDFKQGPRPASREDILTVLANIDTILIRAQQSSDVASAYLSDITLDTAVEQYTGQSRATDVEVCRCPLGYRGTSCELCASGYYRDVNDKSGGPLGSCNRCPCNSNEASCTMGRDNRVVCNCLPGYTGSACEINVSPEVTTSTTPRTPSVPTPTIEVNIVPSTTIGIYEVGSSLTLRCTARSLSQKPVQITWTKDGSPLPYHAIDNGQGLLVITDLRISDSGRYICQATDGLSIVTEHVVVNVGTNRPEPPRVTVNPNYLDISEGEPIEVQCHSSGNPQPTLQFRRKDGRDLNPTHLFTNGVFFVLKSSQSDSGEYECIARNFEGADSSTVTIHVTKIVEKIQKVTITPPYFQGIEGNQVTLRCSGEGVPHSIAWTKLNGILPYNSRDIDGSLTIYDAKTEDSGVYVCTIINYLGVSGTGNATVTIRSQGGIYPTVRVSPERLTASQGTTVQLRCDATGVPPPSIKWTKLGSEFGANTEQIGPVLYIRNIQVADRGVYVCVATNDNGFSQSSSIIDVNRLIAPILEIHPQETQTVTEGSSAILQCRITDGVPEPTVRWTGPNGRSLSPNIEQLSGNLLRFTQITLAEGGQYLCTAENEAGTSTATATIIVQTPPQLIVSPDVETLRVVQNSHVNLTCRATGIPQPSVQWIKYGRTPELRYDAPPSSVAIHRITHVTPDDEGFYICQGRNTAGATERRIQLIISPPRGDIPDEDGGAGDNEIPYVPDGSYTTPSRPDVRANEHLPPYDHVITTSVGTRAEFRCQIQNKNHPNRIYINWIRDENSTSLPSNSYQRDGTLYIDNAQPSDAGIYTCVGIDNGLVLFTQRTLLEIIEPPRITLSPPKQVVPPGENVYIHCSATGYQPIRISWSAMGRPMPPSVSTSEGYLQFRGIQPSDAGRYRCTAVNAAGEADSVAEVVVTGRARETTTRAVPTLHISSSGDPVHVGENLELHCQSSEPGVITTWSKLSGRLANNVQTSSGSLRVVSVRPENVGIYRCEATGYQGVYHRDYNLDIVDTNEDFKNEAPLETQKAEQGSKILMDCHTNLEEPVKYIWSKQGGLLPNYVNIYSRSIQLNDITALDAGTYVCTASNRYTSIDVPKVLIVTGIVPFFAQAPVSYLALPTFPDAYAQFTFEISFKPERGDGLILYNGHKKNERNSDFISLSLVGGIPEFRFNLGNSVTVLRAARPVSLGEWHTVKVSRNRKKGTMYVDGEGPLTAMSEGKYLGLDLIEPLYLGGVPNFSEISPEAAATSGFVGCISRFKIGHAHQDIMRDANVKQGITTCETCSENPCQNDGVCQEALSPQGYMCICPSGFSGPTCNKLRGEACTPHACGIGRCVDNENSFDCYCPFGRTGRRCEREIAINEPAFSDGAYIAYPTPKPQRRLKISMKIKPNDAEDGILIYCSESEEGHGDFASLAIKDRHLEFRFDVGNGPTIIRSSKEVLPGQWVIVSASRSLSEGRLIVNGDNPVVGRSPGNHKALNLQIPLYVGGYDKTRVKVNRGVGVTDGFNGCIADISVSGLELNIIESVTDSANVEDCSAESNNHNNEISPYGEEVEGRIGYGHENTHPPQSYNNKQTGCSSNPCKNNGQCFPLSPFDYECTCSYGFTGRDCETAIDLCEERNPCQNGGTCLSNSTQYECSCPLGYSGVNCEQRAPIKNDVQFNGNGYLELSRNLLVRQRREESDLIAVEFSTNSSEGLVFWHGQKENENGQGQDYIALAVVNGFLEFSFDLGSGPVIIHNGMVRVNDGERHNVILKRNGKSGSIEIDRDHIEEGEADGITNTLNCAGNIYLGGVPNYDLMTGGKFVHGFNGCVHGFELQSSNRIDLGAKAINGINVKACSRNEEYGYNLNDLVN